MTKKHILKTNFSHDYFLIGIKSVLEDYRLAYFLNKTFNLQLEKEAFTLQFSSRKGAFPVYGFEDDFTNNYWSLIANKQVVEEKMETDIYSLFSEISNTYILIKEENRVDYFLKIETNYKQKDKEACIKKINSIHRVITSYEIDSNQLKSKDLLIF